MSICVLIPAYNEANTIKRLVGDIKQFNVDVIVIDDGSQDDTYNCALQAGAYTKRFDKNRGKGAALKEGFEIAAQKGYDIIVTMDADGQHSPYDIPKFLEQTGEPNIGLVVGNRMQNPTGMPYTRRTTNFLMSIFLSILCRQFIPDTQCGFRLIKTEVLKKIHLISSNYEIESELIIRTARLGYKIISVPIKSIYRGQRSNINPFIDTLRFITMLVKVILI